MGKIGFDSELYRKMQSEKIRERISLYDKLYLEFGGKLFDDYHASRVLPGFLPDGKLQMLLTLKEEAELLIVINAADIANNKVRHDLGISYDQDVLRLIDAFRMVDLYVGSVVITQYAGQPEADTFIKLLKKLGVKVYKHYNIKGYPSDVEYIVSDQGFGKNDYVETTRKLVIVTAPGPGSGKMATCLSQLYQENKRGVKAGYAKFETFPIWNIPLKHPVNVAYEAATADLNDVNMIDPFHLEAYGVATVNYNRDVEVFPVLDAMFKKIHGTSPYKSPTDMGVNMAGYCIYDDEAVQFAAKQEIIRRYLKGWVDFKNGLADEKTIHRLEFLMSKLSLKVEDRAVVVAAREKEEKTGKGAMAIELPDGRMIRGKGSDNMCAAASCVFNAVKVLADIPKSEKLISPEVIAPINKLKKNTLKDKDKALNLEEALLICASSDETAKKALEQLTNLNGCQAHSTFILKEVDEEALRKLGINVTSDAKFLSNDLIQ